MDGIEPGVFVRMNRRPFFRGWVVSVQRALPGFEKMGGGAHVRWEFMPDGWATRRPVSFEKLKVLEVVVG